MTAWPPEAALPGILDPFMWIEVLDPTLTTDLRTGRSVWLIRVVGCVKPVEAGRQWPGLPSQEAVNVAARALREELHRRAEDAIEAAVKAGFTLTDCPEIGFDGRLRHDRDTGLDMPEIRAPVTLWFRPPAEAA